MFDSKYASATTIVNNLYYIPLTLNYLALFPWLKKKIQKNSQQRVLKMFYFAFECFIFTFVSFN